MGWGGDGQLLSEAVGGGWEIWRILVWLRVTANDVLVGVTPDFRSGRAGEVISFFILFFSNGKVWEKIKWPSAEIGRAGGGGHFILFYSKIVPKSSQNYPKMILT